MVTVGKCFKADKIFFDIAIVLHTGHISLYLSGYLLENLINIDMVILKYDLSPVCSFKLSP